MRCKEMNIDHPGHPVRDEELSFSVEWPLPGLSVRSGRRNTLPRLLYHCTAWRAYVHEVLPEVIFALADGDSWSITSLVNFLG